MRLKHLLETYILSSEEKSEMIRHFKEWSGGFYPDECAEKQKDSFLRNALDIKYQADAFNAAYDFIHHYDRDFLKGLVDKDLNEAWDGQYPSVGSVWFIIGNVWPGTVINGKTQHPHLSAGRLTITEVGRNLVFFTHGGREYWCKVNKLMNNVSKTPRPEDIKFLKGLIDR